MEIDQLLEKATQVASAITNYTALSLRPKQSTIAIRRYEAVYLDSHSFIIVMVSAISDVVKTTTVKLPFEVTQETIAHLTEVLNRNLANVSVEQINMPVMIKMESELSECPELISIVTKNIYEAMNKLGSEIKFEGVNRLLQYPEYSDLDKLQRMISTIEAKSDIVDAISTIDQSDDDIKIFIGSENVVKIMDDSTLIYKNLKLNGKTIGAIGIIGPCRMDYSKVLATIDKLSYEISHLADLSNMLPSAEDEEK
jgi:heat-inducible transcriptional repressor